MPVTLVGESFFQLRPCTKERKPLQHTWYWLYFHFGRLPAAHLMQHCFMSGKRGAVPRKYLPNTSTNATEWWRSA